MRCGGCGISQTIAAHKGYYSDADKEICIQVGMGESQTIKTMIHEVAHAMLHNSDLMKQRGEEKDRLTKETEAESIAFTVCSALDIDTSDYSFPYVASWASGKEMKELKDSMDTIRLTAADFLEKLEVSGSFFLYASDVTRFMPA